MSFIGGEQDLETLLLQKDHLGILQHIRTHRLRQPKLVIEHADILLGSNLKMSSTLTDSERLSVLEQLLLAALDISNPQLADDCLIAIRGTDGVPQNSTRVRRLIGQCLESLGDSEKATQVYDDLLRENQANAIVLKRKYTMLASVVGKEVEAREALHEYVQYQQGDSGAWMEIYQSCMEIGDYKGAAFAVEEMLLASPLDAHLHCMLGEVYATIGGLSNLQLARKHLSMSLELKIPESGNLRALYSLISVANAYIDEFYGSKKNQKDANIEFDVEVAKELVKFGGESIQSLYAKYGKNSELAKIVNRVISTYPK